MIDQDPFSNGTEYMFWVSRNCEQCWKSSKYIEKEDRYTPIRCAVERDIFTRMITDKTPISQRSYDICQQSDCPYRQEKRKKYARGTAKLPKLF